jgi:hypothetical protein
MATAIVSLLAEEGRDFCPALTESASNGIPRFPGQPMPGGERPPKRPKASEKPVPEESGNQIWIMKSTGMCHR